MHFHEFDILQLLFFKWRFQEKENNFKIKTSLLIALKSTLNLIFCLLGTTPSEHTHYEEILERLDNDTI